jgi:hypothetical protein
LLHSQASSFSNLWCTYMLRCADGHWKAFGSLGSSSASWSACKGHSNPSRLRSLTSSAQCIEDVAEWVQVTVDCQGGVCTQTEAPSSVSIAGQAPAPPATTASVCYTASTNPNYCSGQWYYANELTSDATLYDAYGAQRLCDESNCAGFVVRDLPDNTQCSQWSRWSWHYQCFDCANPGYRFQICTDTSFTYIQPDQRTCYQSGTFTLHRQTTC